MTCRAILLSVGLMLPLWASAATPVQSAGNFGLGLGSGTHANGLSGKYFLGTDLAFQGVVGFWNRGGRDRGGGLGLSADLLWEQRPLVQVDVLDVAWNVGAGVNTRSVDRGLGLGVQGVAGLEFNFVPVPIDIVLEYRPNIDIVPGTDLELVDFGAHIRIYPF